MKNLYILFITFLLSFSTQAQLGTDVFSVGEDNAGNYGSWSSGDNQGTGFDTWTLTQVGGGSYVGGSGVGNPSLALFSNGFGNFSSATRNFSSSLKRGDTFSVDLGHTTTINGEIFLQLLDNGNPVITLKFVGGTSDWQLNDGGSDFTIGQPYLANSAISFAFTYNEDGTYSYTFGAASGSNFSASNSIANINGFRFQSNNQGPGENFGINNLLIESKYTITENSTVSVSGDTTVPYLDVQSGSTVNIPPTSNLTVSGDLNVSGALNLTSTSTQYPSLIVNGTSTGNITYNRHVNGNSILGDPSAVGNNDLISPPVSGQSFGAFSSANPNLLENPSDATVKAFAIFDKTTGSFVNYTTTANAGTLLNAGVGYRAASDDTSTLAFTGTVNTGSVDIDITNGGPDFEEWNLVGNPYPSYLDVFEFLTHEVDTGVQNINLFDGPSAAIYGYDGTGYVVDNVLNLANSSGVLIAPGQGFFVSANAANVAAYDLEFTSAMRSTGTTDDFIAGRNAALVFLKLNASTSNNSYNTEFYFNNNSSLGFDLGYDAKMFGTTPDFALYSHLVEDNSGDAIALQSLNTSDLSDVTIPLGVNANQGQQLTFSIADTSLPASINVYLEDTVANTTTLLNTSDYVITPATALSGTGRFFLRTSEDALSTIDNSLDTLTIFALNSTKELVVTGALESSSVLSLYDIQGRTVLSAPLDSTSVNNRIDVSNLSGGVYVVTVQNTGQQKTQKVILK